MALRALRAVSAGCRSRRAGDLGLRLPESYEGPAGAGKSQQLSAEKEGLWSRSVKILGVIFAACSFASLECSLATFAMALDAHVGCFPRCPWTFVLKDAFVMLRRSFTAHSPALLQLQVFIADIRNCQTKEQERQRVDKDQAMSFEQTWLREPLEHVWAGRGTVEDPAEVCHAKDFVRL